MKFIIDGIIHFFDKIKAKIPEDPVKTCEVYSERGCSHVDGFLCVPSKCEIRSNYVQMPKNGRNSACL